VRKFATFCVNEIAYKAQGYPTDAEIVLHSILELGHLGFIYEGATEKVRPLSKMTFHEMNDAMVTLNKARKMPDDPAEIVEGTSPYNELAKIVAVLKNELRIVPTEFPYDRIWTEVIKAGNL